MKQYRIVPCHNGWFDYEIQIEKKFLCFRYWSKVRRTDRLYHAKDLIKKWRELDEN